VFDPGHRTGRKPPFRFAVYTRVAFSDTDAQGVVYYGRYLPYFDLARTEYHRHLRGDDNTAPAEFVMRASNVEYLAPARFDDPLEVFVRVAAVGRTSMTYEYAAYRISENDELLMVTAAQTVVLIDHANRKPMPIPDSLRELLDAFEKGGL
jgi:acyl-CoA thioester hydrolase